MMDYGWDMGSGGWVVMIIFWVGLLTLIGWAVARAFPSVNNRGGGDSAGQETPQGVLDRRYAAGELDTETYQSMRAALASSRRAGEM